MFHKKNRSAVVGGGASGRDMSWSKMNNKILLFVVATTILLMNISIGSDSQQQNLMFVSSFVVAPKSSKIVPSKTSLHSAVVFGDDPTTTSVSTGINRRHRRRNTSSTTSTTDRVSHHHQNGNRSWLQSIRQVISSKNDWLLTMISKRFQVHQQQEQQLVSGSNPLESVTTAVLDGTTTVSTKSTVGSVSPILNIHSLEQFQQLTTTMNENNNNHNRYMVVKYHATWCKTCAKFGIRLDKLVAQQKGTIQFASVEYIPTNRIIFDSKNVTHLPTVHIYDTSDGKKVYDSLACPPSQFQSIYDTIQMYATTTTTTTTKPTTTETKEVTNNPTTTSTSSNDVNDNSNLYYYDFLQSTLYQDATLAALQISYRSRSF